MIRRLSVVLALALLAVLPPACSSASGGSYAEKCAAACTPPTSGPCNTQDSNECQTECVALTDGLSVACAQCIVEHTGWSGVSCPSGCTDCCPCGFSTAGGTSTCEGGTGCSCSAADEKCDGFEIGKASDSACKSSCYTQ